jgi:hypothetical protein
MTEGRRIAICGSYDELIKALRKRADELKITRETIDAVSGIQAGYAGKLLAPVPIRMLGRVSLGPVLQCLGLTLIVAEDTTALDRIRTRLTKRRRAPRMLATSNAGRKKHRKRWRFPKGSDHARLMRARQIAQQEPAQRSAIARIAARARWQRARMVPRAATRCDNARR